MGKFANKVISEGLFKYIHTKVEEEIRIEEERAGYNGGLPDRSDQIRLGFYSLGYYKELPDIWEKYAVEYEHLKDPEYAEYLRLKEKFK